MILQIFRRKRSMALSPRVPVRIHLHSLRNGTLATREPTLADCTRARGRGGEDSGRS